MLQPLLLAAWTGRPRTRDLRQVVNGFLYALRAGCVWGLVCSDFGPWVAVYYFRKLLVDETTERLNHEL